MIRADTALMTPMCPFVLTTKAAVFPGLGPGKSWPGREPTVRARGTIGFLFFDDELRINCVNDAEITALKTFRAAAGIFGEVDLPAHRFHNFAEGDDGGESWGTAPVARSHVEGASLVASRETGRRKNPESGDPDGIIERVSFKLKNTKEFRSLFTILFILPPFACY
ncbi:hypothetical protein FRC03_004556 [Tulasnella sp. 419]|nr:hypothetical protein FRC03_004556 [Tulasnella sp. 419]